MTHGLEALLARQVQSRYVACRISVRQGLACGKVQCMARLDRHTVSSAPTVSSRPKDSCSWMAELHRALMHASSLNSKRANATCRRMPRPCDHQVRDCSVDRNRTGLRSLPFSETRRQMSGAGPALKLHEAQAQMQVSSGVKSDAGGAHAPPRSISFQKLLACLNMVSD